MSRAEHDGVISAIGTVFGVLLIVLFAMALTSDGAINGPDAFVVRWTVLSLAVAFSGSVGGLRWRMLIRAGIVVQGRRRDKAEIQGAETTPPPFEA